MNNKGFMMAEVVVVSAIVMVTIVGLYQSYNKLYSTYNTRIDYYDSTTLYRLGYYRDILIENNLLKIDKETGNLYINNNDVSNTKVVDIYSSNGNTMFSLSENELQPNVNDTVLLIKTNKSSDKFEIIIKINESSKKFEINGAELDNINLTFKDYLKYLSTSTTFESSYIMVMERCTSNDDNSKNIDDCKYAYLEIYDGKE